VTQRTRRIRPEAPIHRAGLASRAAGRCVGLALAGLLSVPASARADVVRDGRVGSAGAGAVASEADGAGGLRYLIRESDGQRAGNNLFHSFSRLDLTSNETAVYQGDAGIRNLITTITGGRSSIDGRIASEIPGANLYLLNPDGVIFGENASFDLSGSLTVSTADRLHFANGDTMATAGPPPGILSVADPSGFGFLDAPAPIRVEGSRIELEPGGALHLVGGELDLLGGRADGGSALIATRGGRLDLVALASAGDVFLEPDGVRIEGDPRLADVTLADDIAVTTSGIDPDPYRAVTHLEAPKRGSGAVFVHADDLTIRDAELRTLTVSVDPAGDVSIDLTGKLAISSVEGGRNSGIFADTGFREPLAPGQVVTLPQAFVQGYGEAGAVVADLCGASFCGVRYPAVGDAGDVRIRARDVSVSDGGKITARSIFYGNAGTIDIAFRDEMEIVGRRGPDDVSLITTSASGEGDPGTIRIHSDGGLLRMDDYGTVLIQNSAQSNVASAAGLISIDVGELAMSGNARIDSSVRGFGPGGLIDVRASERITLSGRTDDIFFTGITTLAQPGSLGPPGEIHVTTPELVMTDGARISASAVDETSFPTGGNLVFDIRDRMILRDATIATESPFSGGDILLSVGEQLLLERSSITTSVSAFFLDGGNITIRPGPETLVLRSSQIIARSDGGTGGRIDIEAGSVLIDPRSTIDARSRLGVDGVVLINGVEGNVVPEVAQLATPSADLSGLVREPCAAQRPGASNRFVIDDRPRLAVESDDYLAAPMAELLVASTDDGSRLANAPRASDLASAEETALAAALPASLHGSTASRCPL